MPGKEGLAQGQQILSNIILETICFRDFYI